MHVSRLGIALLYSCFTVNPSQGTLFIEDESCAPDRTIPGSDCREASGAASSPAATGHALIQWPSLGLLQGQGAQASKAGGGQQKRQKQHEKQHHKVPVTGNVSLAIAKKPARDHANASALLSALQTAASIPGKQIWRDLAGVALPAAPEDMYGLSRRRRSTDLHFPSLAAPHVPDQLASVRMAAYNLPMSFDLHKDIPMPGSELYFPIKSGTDHSVNAQRHITSPTRTVEHVQPPPMELDPDTGMRVPDGEHPDFERLDLEDSRFHPSLLADSAVQSSEVTEDLQSNQEAGPHDPVVKVMVRQQAAWPVAMKKRTGNAEGSEEVEMSVQETEVQQSTAFERRLSLFLGLIIFTMLVAGGYVLSHWPMAARPPADSSMPPKGQKERPKPWLIFRPSPKGVRPQANARC